MKRKAEEELPYGSQKTSKSEVSASSQVAIDLKDSPEFKAIKESPASDQPDEESFKTNLLVLKQQYLDILERPEFIAVLKEACARCVFGGSMHLGVLAETLNCSSQYLTDQLQEFDQIKRFSIMSFAASLKDSRLLQHLLAEKEDLADYLNDVKAHGGDTPLAVAQRFYRINNILLLLAKKADPFSWDKPDGLLRWALKEIRLDILNEILRIWFPSSQSQKVCETYGEDELFQRVVREVFTCEYSEPLTLLMQEYGCSIQYLTDRLKECKFNRKSKIMASKSLITYASSFADKALLQNLLNLLVSQIDLVNYLNNEKFHGGTLPLIAAVRSRPAAGATLARDPGRENISLLLEYGASPTALNRKQESAVSYAVKENSSGLILLLGSKNIKFYQAGSQIRKLINRDEKDEKHEEAEIEFDDEQYAVFEKRREELECKLSLIDNLSNNSHNYVLMSQF